MLKITKRYIDKDTHASTIDFTVGEISSKLVYDAKAKDLILELIDIRDLDLDTIFQRKDFKQNLFKAFEWLDIINVHFSKYISINGDKIEISQAIDYITTNFDGKEINSLEILLGMNNTFDRHLDIIDIMANETGNLIFK